jgi:hypothetical protein
MIGKWINSAVRSVSFADYLLVVLAFIMLLQARNQKQRRAEITKFASMEAHFSLDAPQE